MSSQPIKDFTITVQGTETIVEHNEFSTKSNPINRAELVRMLHSEVDGKEPHLWSDYDFEEPSTIMYFYLRDNKYVIASDMNDLVWALNDDKHRQFTQVEIEDSLL